DDPDLDRVAPAAPGEDDLACVRRPRERLDAADARQAQPPQHAAVHSEYRHVLARAADRDREALPVGRPGERVAVAPHAVQTRPVRTDEPYDRTVVVAEQVSDPATVGRPDGAAAALVVRVGARACE